MFKRIYHNGFLIETINVENMQPLKMIFVSKRINCIPMNYLKYLILTLQTIFNAIELVITNFIVQKRHVLKI